MEGRKWLTLIGIALVILLGLAGLVTRESFASGTYRILAWNDLGMHCYSRDFADMAVLPPYNTLWVQVIKAGDPPELVTSGITVEYYYQDNTRSDNKTNFWAYDKALFGVDLPLNVGLKGKGLSGTMDLSGDHFIAEGIPITEYSDSAPTVRQPYQLATVVVKDSTTQQVLTSIQVVTPTSSEMRCDNCHTDTGIARPSHPTGKVETNILQLHDENAGTALMTSRPVLCASCHASNALGAPGKPGVNNLSKSMHQQHASVVPSTLDGCYNCHPGPQTRCLRDVMSNEEGMTCVSCHGGLGNVSTNPNPWLIEPRCDSCHNSGPFAMNQALYRFSRGHGGLYCETCHDSTHAIAPSREANDAIKFNQLQGRNGPIDQCSVCHTQTPITGGPHASNPPRVTSIIRKDVNPTSATAVNFTVTFSQSVRNIDKNDFALTTTGVTSPAITNVTGSGTSYTITVSTGVGDGSIRLDVSGTSNILNLQGNPLVNIPFTSGDSYTIVKPVTFADVPNSHPFWRYIEAFYKAGITTGCSQSPKMYCPDNLVTRGEMAVFIERAKGNFNPQPNPSGMFADMPYLTFTSFIEQFYNDGITTGCAQNPLMYCPTNNVTRGEMAVFIERAIGHFNPQPNPSGMFADMPYLTFTPFIEQFYNDGITTGCAQDPLKYCPANNVTRAEMAVFIVRAFHIPLP